MTPPRFAVTPHQHVVTRIQKQNLRAHAVARELFKQRHRFAECAAAAHVERNGDLAHLRIAQKRKRLRNEFRRKVIYTVEPQIFKRLHCLTFAGAREAGDENQPGAFNPHETVFARKGQRPHPQSGPFG